MKISRTTGCALLLLGALSLPAAGDTRVGSIESTTAFQLLEIERSVRTVQPDAPVLLRAVLTDATEAAQSTHRDPKSIGEALEVLNAIQESLERHNFLQPEDKKDWPLSLGNAFVPLQLSKDQLAVHLAQTFNARRRARFDLTKPFYFVDCDMGAELFLAVGQRLGWDIRLVEVPDHNFVRWHFSKTVSINWDWTQGRSVPDSDYVRPTELFASLVSRGIYLRSFTPVEARAYYLGLIGAVATKTSDKIELLEKAIAGFPMQAANQNNLAWTIATDKELASKKAALAVSNSLASLSVDPDDGARVDTLACAFSIRGEWALALALEDYAASHAASEGDHEGFLQNKKRIEAKELCQ
ncbi:MAG: hypothetical protein ABI769_20230 [Pseudomonadota bacterium]